MGNQKAACLLDGGYEDSEFRVPYDALKKAGCQVEIIGMKAGAELKGYKGKELVKVDKSIDEVKAGEYAALPAARQTVRLAPDSTFLISSWRTIRPRAGP